ncbi:MAG: hypothetical protein FWG80_02995 [Alphaproteobacteria bacterium]|nr:hypothetical protein [Alphaproteobacteria bacterium]
MKKISLLALFGLLFANFADAAAPRGRSQGGGGSASAAAAPAGGGVSRGRSGTVTAGMSQAAAPAAAAPAGGNTVSRGRSGTTPTSGAAPAAPAVSAARAGTTQRAMAGSGALNVAGAASVAGVVDPVCRERWFGCMDSFCMTDNDHGGRCICSNRKSELDKILAEIEKLDAQSLKMATERVEMIEMGASAEFVMEQQRLAEAATQTEETNTRSNRGRSSTVNTALWNINAFGEEDEIAPDPLAGKVGDDLHTTVRGICTQQISGCEKDIRMLQTMYSAEITNNCRAYENALKARQQQSTQRLQAAQSAVREAARESYESSNKFELGPCVAEFRKCMAGDGGCGSDFTNCVGISATTNALSTSNVRNSTRRVPGTSIDLAVSSFDTLSAKKPLCEHVTNQCVRFKDQVWDVFLRDIAPTIKSAEIIAEDKARQNCLGNVVECFQNACGERFDPGREEASYDMCITNPLTMTDVCRIPLQNCGISHTQPTQSRIWDYVVARMGAMRVDGCTKEVKSCLQNEDRCGENYGQCIGLSLDAIGKMCPAASLVACRDGAQSKTVEDIESMIQGILLGIDNNQLSACQAAAEAAMTTICGSSEDCSSIAQDNKTIGVSALKKSERSCTGTSAAGGCWIISAGGGTAAGGGNTTPLPHVLHTLSGDIDWDKISYNPAVRSGETVTPGNVSIAAEGLEPEIVTELNAVKRLIDEAFGRLRANATVSQCVSGRDTARFREGSALRGGSEANFPNLLDEAERAIFHSILRHAITNFNAKRIELQEEVDNLNKAERDRIMSLVNEAAQRELKDKWTAEARQKCNEIASPADGVCLTQKTRNWWLSFKKNLQCVSERTLVKTTFNSNTELCRICTSTAACSKTWGAFSGKKGTCRTWHGWSEETCEEVTVF